MICQQLCNWPIGYPVSVLTEGLFTTKESAVRLFSSRLISIVIITSWFAIGLDEIRTRRNLREKTVSLLQAVQDLAWVSCLPKGLGERRSALPLFRFHLSPFPPETPDTQANIDLIHCTCHLCTHFKIDRIKAICMFYIFQGGKQVVKLPMWAIVVEFVVLSEWDHDFSL